MSKKPRQKGCPKTQKRLGTLAPKNGVFGPFFLGQSRDGAWDSISASRCFSTIKAGVPEVSQGVPAFKCPKTLSQGRFLERPGRDSWDKMNEFEVTK